VKITLHINTSRLSRTFAFISWVYTGLCRAQRGSEPQPADAGRSPCRMWGSWRHGWGHPEVQISRQKALGKTLRVQRNECTMSEVPPKMST